MFRLYFRINMSTGTLPFAIVIYRKKHGSKEKERHEVFCAPRSWVITDDLAYWPPYTDLEACAEAARNEQAPVHDWDKYEITIKKYVSKYDN